jgi:hypothetical protein
MAMAMNADLLAPGSKVFYLRGTTGERKSFHALNTFLFARTDEGTFLCPGNLVPQTSGVVIL